MEAEPKSTREDEPAAGDDGVEWRFVFPARLHAKPTAVRGETRRWKGALLAALGFRRWLRICHLREVCIRGCHGQVRVAAAVVVLVGCPGSEPKPEPSPEQALVGPLRFELPAGVRVMVDGVAHGVTPLEPLEVSAAAHQVRLATACDEVEQEVAVQGGSGATITRGSVSGLRFATVQIQAKTIRDKPLSVKLYLGGAEVVGDGNRFEIPACAARMRVEPTGTLAYGLGGFIEDIEPKAGASMNRDLVLRPGPDVVRIYGGAFRPGPHKDDDPERPRSFLKPERTVMETFDMDRTEVTARQFMECFGEKRCEPDHGHLGFRSRCVFETEDLQGPESLQFGRRLIEGKEDLPANCMTIYEAKAYCEWRGMRLPTPVEMEFAARSRKSAYRFPWGNDESECRAFGWSVPECNKDVTYYGGVRMKTYNDVDWTYSNPQLACSFAEGKGVSEQGVCDLAGNLLEFAMFEGDEGDPDKQVAFGGAWAESVDTAALTGDSRPADTSIGVRCLVPHPEGVR